VTEGQGGSPISLVFSSVGSRPEALHASPVRTDAEETHDSLRTRFLFAERVRFLCVNAMLK